MHNFYEIKDGLWINLTAVDGWKLDEYGHILLYLQGKAVHTTITSEVWFRMVSSYTEIKLHKKGN